LDEYVRLESDYDVITGKYFLPGYPGPWFPPEPDIPSREDVETLQFMSKKLREEIAELKSKRSG
jgi:hypothetical protein